MKRPLRRFLYLVRPLRLPLALIVIAALFPLFQALWLLAIPLGLLWARFSHVDHDAVAAERAAARLSALETYRIRRLPGNAIRRTGRHGVGRRP
jgi:hypothetical protein